MNSVAPLLAVEIGNSRFKFGLFLDWLTPHPSQLPSCQEVLTASSNGDSIPWDRLQTMMENNSPLCLVSSVNPPALARFLHEFSCTGWPEPMVIRSFSQLPIVNQTSPPEQTGIDRLLKGVAGNVLRPADRPMILVDSGTATTVDWVNAAGEFAGGAILPGLSLSSRALHDHTAQLPLIAAEDLGQSRPATIGKNTVEALRSGLYWGHVGAVRELIRCLSAKNSGSGQFVLVTGGAGQILAKELKLSGFHRDLTLQGLAITARHLFANRP